jgi:hypothetical protein
MTRPQWQERQPYQTQQNNLLLIRKYIAKALRHNNTVLKHLNGRGPARTMDVALSTCRVLTVALADMDYVLKQRKVER